MIAWEPPGRLVLAWNVANAEALATEVEVRFTAEGDVTRVELEHRGWEALAEDGARSAETTTPAWEYVLGRYEERVS